jgi:hypothetical protein
MSIERTSIADADNHRRERAHVTDLETCTFSAHRYRSPWPRWRLSSRAHRGTALCSFLRLATPSTTTSLSGKGAKLRLKAAPAPTAMATPRQGACIIKSFLLSVRAYHLAPQRSTSTTSTASTTTQPEWDQFASCCTSCTPVSPHAQCASDSHSAHACELPGAIADFGATATASRAFGGRRAARLGVRSVSRQSLGSKTLLGSPRRLASLGSVRGKRCVKVE